MHRPNNTSNIRISVTNDINEAYQRVLNIIKGFYGFDDSIIASPHNVDELLPEMGGYQLKITIHFNDVVDHGRLDDYTIFSINPEAPNYLNPNILSYPLLAHKDMYVAFERVIKRKKRNNGIAQSYPRIVSRDHYTIKRGDNNR
jgi:hypothetical protein